MRFPRWLPQAGSSLGIKVWGAPVSSLSLPEPAPRPPHSCFPKAAAHPRPGEVTGHVSPELTSREPWARPLSATIC